MSSMNKSVAVLAVLAMVLSATAFVIVSDDSDAVAGGTVKGSGSSDTMSISYHQVDGYWIADLAFQVSGPDRVNVYVGTQMIGGVPFADTLRIILEELDAGSYPVLVNSVGGQKVAECVLSVSTYYELSLTAGTGGSVDGAGEYAVGETVIPQYVAGTGYVFDKWEVLSGNITIGMDGSFTMPASDVSLKALFKEKSTPPGPDPDPPRPTTYSVTVQNDGHGAASASPSKASAGTSVRLTAIPASGYVFDKWEVISGGVTITDDRFTMPSKNVVVKALFKESAPSAVYEVVYSSGTGSGVVPVDTKKYSIGSNLVTASGSTLSKDGYAFIGWTVGGSQYASCCGYTFTSEMASKAVSGKLTLTAVWLKIDSETVTVESDDGKSSIVVTDDMKEVIFDIGDVSISLPISSVPEAVGKDLVVIVDFVRDDVYDISMTLGGKSITIPSGMEMTLPYDPSKGNPVVFWIDNDPVAMETVEVDQKRNEITFLTEHNSTYEVRYVEKVDVTLTFQSDGPDVDSITGTVGDRITLPSAGSMDGKEFKGWYIGDNLIGQSGDSFILVEDSTLTAKWDTKNDRMVIYVVVAMLAIIAVIALIVVMRHRA